MRIHHRIGAVATVAIACATAALGGPTTHADAGPDGPPATGTTVDGSAVRPVARAKRITRTVYVCADPSPVTFSDRPCGPLHELRLLDLHEPPPGSAPALATPAAAASTRPAGRRPPAHVLPDAPADPDPREERCRRLLAQRDAINERMRSGYSARQAAQLWARWRDVGREIYADRC